MDLSLIHVSKPGVTLPLCLTAKRVSARIETLGRHAGENTLEAQLELEGRHQMESVNLH